MGFKFLPLFYTNEFHNNNCKREYDIFTAVSKHSDRMKIMLWFLDNKKVGYNLLFYIIMGKFDYLTHLLKILFFNKFNGELYYRANSIKKSVMINYINK